MDGLTEVGVCGSSGAAVTGEDVAESVARVTIADVVVGVAVLAGVLTAGNVPVVAEGLHFCICSM